VLVVVALAAANIACRVAVLGAGGVTPFGSKPKVTRILFMPKCTDDNVVVVTGITVAKVSQ
jgi:hypothetical protein